MTRLAPEKPRRLARIESVHAMSITGSHWAALTVLLWLLCPSSAFGSERAPAWWEITTGVLAIPAALVGLIYSFALIRKTRLEARKTELEIAETEGRLREVTASMPADVREAIQPSVQGQLGVLLLVRFVVLYLLLRVWNAIDTVLEYALKGTAMGIMKLTGTDTASNPWWLFAPYVALSNIPEVAYWLTFAVFGWSLLRDCSTFLGLGMKDLFALRNGGSRNHEEVATSGARVPKSPPE